MCYIMIVTAHKKHFKNVTSSFGYRILKIRTSQLFFLFVSTVKTTFLNILLGVILNKKVCKNSAQQLFQEDFAMRKIQRTTLQYTSFFSYSSFYSNMTKTTTKYQRFVILFFPFLILFFFCFSLFQNHNSNFQASLEKSVLLVNKEKLYKSCIMHCSFVEKMMQHDMYIYINLNVKKGYVSYTNMNTDVFLFV